MVRGKKEPTDSESPADTEYMQKEKGPFLSRWRYTRMAITWLLILLFVTCIVEAHKLVDGETKKMKCNTILRQTQVDDGSISKCVTCACCNELTASPVTKKHGKSALAMTLGSSNARHSVS